MRISDWSSDVCSSDLVQWRLPTAVAAMKQLQEVIEDAGAADAQAKISYASQLQSLKNGIKRYSGELDGLQRSDAVSVRQKDEAAMLAWLDGQRTAKIGRAHV